MIKRFLVAARLFESDARRILASEETSKDRLISLSASYKSLGALSLKQDELFRQSLRCIENALYRAAHVLSWAGFIDFFEEKLASDGFRKLHAAYSSWASHISVEELREHVTEYQLIEAGRVIGLLSKHEMKALHGLLNKRNECAHPSNYFPGLNESLGYISELIQRISMIQPKKL
jgi:hypothetical protein